MLVRKWIKENTYSLLVGLQTCTASVEVLQKTKLIFLKIQVDQSWAYTQGTLHPTTETYSSMFTAALFIRARNWKETICLSAEEAITKLWYICKIGYYSVVKKSEIMSFSGKCMELEKNIILNGINQTPKGKDKMTIPVPRMGCILLRSWPKMSHVIPQLSQAIVKAMTALYNLMVRP